MGESLPDEAKAFDVCRAKGDIVLSSRSTARRRQQPVPMVELQRFNSHAHGPSQLGKSEMAQHHRPNTQAVPRQPF